MLQQEIKQVNHQKLSLKTQIDEYEQKIKSLLSELEQNSKQHIKEVKDLHDHYMGNQG
jgi:predicted  nucleic acid-binding Zn-ribbon protein